MLQGAGERVAVQDLTVAFGTLSVGLFNVFFYIGLKYTTVIQGTLIVLVVMVGGATRMPHVRRAVGEFFHTIPHANIDPDKVVALGAAIQANLLAGNRAPGDDWLLRMIGDLMTTVALFSAGSTLCWVGFLVWITLHSGNSAHSLIKPTMSALAWGVLCVSPLVLGLLLPHGNHGWIVALTVTGVLISTRYYFLLRQAYS